MQYLKIQIRQKKQYDTIQHLVFVVKKKNVFINRNIISLNV